MKWEKSFARRVVVGLVGATLLVGAGGAFAGPRDKDFKGQQKSAKHEFQQREKDELRDFKTQDKAEKRAFQQREKSEKKYYKTVYHPHKGHHDQRHRRYGYQRLMR